jgi:hypothetical protein
MTRIPFSSNELDLPTGISGWYLTPRPSRGVDELDITIDETLHDPGTGFAEDANGVEISAELPETELDDEDSASPTALSEEI